MVEHGQINLRVPDDAKDVLKKVAEKIRDGKGFLARLRRFVNEDDGERSALLEGRMARLEARLAALEEGRASAPAPRPASEPRQTSIFDGEEAPVSQAAGATGGWTQGEGKGRRLTDAGKAELLRLSAAGVTDTAIAKALGINPVSVGRVRIKAAKGE